MVWLLFSCKSKSKLPNDKKAAADKQLQIDEGQNQIDFGRQYIDGCAARMKGNLQEALTLFNNCKKIDPNSAPVAYELGTINKLLGFNNEALSNAKICAAADLKNEWYQLLLIECYNASKQYSQAIKVRETLIKNFPTKTEFKEDLAIEYALVGQYDKAFKIYDELEKTYGINEQIILNKVKLLKSQRKIKEAELELLKLADSNKGEPRFYGYLADFYIDENNWEKAKIMYDKILTIEPNNPTVNLALHDYYSAQGKDAEAYEYLKKAFQNPDLDVNTKANILNSFYTRAKEQAPSNALEQGFELANIMLAVHPKASETNLIYADFLVLKDNLKEASYYYYLSAIQNKRDYTTWEKLLFANYKLSQYDSLEHHSSIAMELFPSLATTYFFNGIANNQLKNHKKAAQSLKDGLEFVTDNKSLMLDFYSNLGDAYNYLKDYPKSDKAFEDALKINSDNTYVLNNYAYYLSLRNEFLDKAENFSKRTNELKPNDRNYMDTYGWILFQQKKYKEADEWLSKAAKMGPKNPTILEHYGDVLYRLNKPEEALKEWNEAKQAGGDSQALLKKIKEKKLND
jgi:tetratricopeptide (TPR) repeat protein